MYAKLVRVFFKENFSLNRFIGTDIRKNKKKALLLGFVILYAFGAFLFSFGYLFFDLGKYLVELDMLDTLLVFLFAYATTLSIMITLFRANGYLFKFKDYEILAPLPLNPRTVLLAKLTVMMSFLYIGLAMVSLPIAFAYFWHRGFDMVTLLIFLVGFLLIPVIPLIIFAFLSLLIARLTSRFRKSNILYTILLFVVVLAFTVFSMSFAVPGEDNPLLQQQGLLAFLMAYYPPLPWFVEAVHDHQLLSLIYLVLSQALPLAAFVFLISKMVVSTNQQALSVKTGKNLRPVKFRQRSVFESLIIKEARKFINVPIYAVNSGFGPIILILIGILSLAYKSKIAAFLTEMTGFPLPIEMVVMVFVGFCVSMVYTSAISLSLEGKNFWLIKSLPLKATQVMQSKMAFNVLLGLPFAFVAIVLMTIAFGISAYSMVTMLLAVAVLSLATSAMGSFINLHFPKFEFLNETEVVKQSIGALIGVFGGFGIMVADGFLISFTLAPLGWNGALLLATLLNALVFLGFYLLVMRSAPRLFAKMGG